MGKLSRRDFMKLAGVGSAGMAVGGAFIAKLLGQPHAETYTFRAVVGLPKAPLPSYASYVLDGSINLGAGSGIVRKTVFAGAPDSMSEIALPGLSRTLRVTDVRRGGDSLLVQAVVDDRDVLRPGESPWNLIRMEPSTGRVVAPLVDTEHMLQLVGYSRD
jgi:hypothetical protein